jgi:hypothetical protein
MERWKELLINDLRNVATGYREVGQDVGKVNGVISQIPTATVDTLVHLLKQNELKHFADKVANGDYHLLQDLEKQKAEEDKLPVADAGDTQ